MLPATKTPAGRCCEGQRVDLLGIGEFRAGLEGEPGHRRVTARHGKKLAADRVAEWGDRAIGSDASQAHAEEGSAEIEGARLGDGFIRRR